MNAAATLRQGSGQARRDGDAVNPRILGVGTPSRGFGWKRLSGDRQTSGPWRAVCGGWCVARFLGVLLFGSALGVGVSACGYHFVGRDGKAPGNIQSIAVGVLENKTTIVGIETIFTNALLDEFVRTERLAVMPPEAADAILSGAITKIQTGAVSHQQAQTTLETQVTITVSLTLKRRGTGEILWQNQSLSYYDAYLETGLPLATSENRRLAIAYIANYLAEKVYQDIFTSF
jgi:hypothetical protein